MKKKKLFYKYFFPLIFLTVIPLLLSGMVLYYVINRDITDMRRKVISQSSEALKTEISYKNELIANQIGHHVEMQIYDAHQKIRTMSQSPTFRSMDLKGIQLYCSTLLYKNPSILEISVVDKQGEEIFKISRDVSIAEEDYKNISNEIVFLSIKKGQADISDVRISDMTHLPYVVITQPIEQYKGKFIGGILASVDLGFVWDVVTGRKVGKKGLSYIISDKGMLITHPSKKEVYQNPEYYKYDYIRRILKEKEGSFIKNGDTLLSFSTNDYSWATIIEIPLKEALQSVEEEKNTISKYIQSTFQTIGIMGSGVIATVLVTSILLGIAITKKIVSPVLELKEATQKVSRGDFSLRINIVRDDEIGELTSSFNKMTEDLQKTTVSKDYLDNIIGSMIDSLIVVSPEGKIITVNQAALDLLGYKEEELIGKDISLLFPEDERKPLGKTMFEKLIEEGQIANYEINCKAKDSRKIPVLFSGSVMRDESSNITDIVCVARDITERKKAEEAIRQQRDFSEKVINAIDSPFYVINLDYTIALANKTALQKGIVEGGYCYQLTHSRQAPCEGKHTCPLQEVLRTKKSVQMEHIHYDKEGNKMVMEIHGHPIFGKGGKVIQMIEYSVDITERKKAEEALAERTQELARSNAELQQFIYVAYHDLQEPLRMVSSYVQLLEKRYKNKLDTDAHEFISYAMDGAQIMRRSIKDLLTLSQVSTRGKPFKLSDCELVLKQTLTNLQTAIEENKAEVTHDPLPEVMADDIQLAQLFQNLIGNAIKFHGDNLPRVHISAKKEKDYWVFSVRDNGIGIAQKYKDKIFQIFQRLHSRAEYPGTGIGLAVCKKIVERHSGRMWVESGLGKGSTFYFTIPIKE